MERFEIAIFLLLFICLLGWDVRLELNNEEMKRQNALYKVQITELQKKQRLTAQDLGFIEKLINEGKTE